MDRSITFVRRAARRLAVRRDGASAPGFFVEVVIGGLLAGVLYSLVALGFVLIFKASGVFNFAQGAMVLFAALTRRRAWRSTDAALGRASLLAIADHGGCWRSLIERLVLRPLVNQEQIILFMATIGLTYLPRRLRRRSSGAATCARLDLGMPKEPMIIRRRR